AIARKLMPPTAFYDLMSYCNPSWVSDYNYQAVQRDLEAQPNITGAPSPYVRALLVTGRFSDSGASIGMVHRVLARIPAVEDSPRTLSVDFAGGHRRLVPVIAHPIADLPDHVEHFATLVEDDGAVSALGLAHAGFSLAQRHRA